VLPAREDPTLAADTVRIAAGHPATAELGAMFGGLTVERFVETLEPGRAQRV